VKAGPPHEVRLIGGRWKRSKLAVADRAGLRPTPDRVRETLFNWLGQDLTGWRCLDAFGGSGALGFEAASRGAAAVTVVESDAGLVKALRAVKERLGAEAVTVVPGDGLSVLGRVAPGSLDLVFVDPPYGSGLLAPALHAAARALAPGGFVYAEDGAPVLGGPAGLEVYRSARAGKVHYALLRAATLPRTPAEGEEIAS
jgi:16S rRNA (guanine(966)-N(2))-methyltransferase RsmD